jgi:cysteinyl-tRNA synthetase
MVANVFSALSDAGNATGAHEEKLRAALVEAETRFVEAMDDDFNTADGLGVLFDLARSCNIYLKEGYPYNKELLEETLQFYRAVNDIFEILDISAPESLDQDISAMIAKRDEARAAKDWAASDRLRDELLERGIIIEDTPHGTRWKKKQ